MSIRLLPLSSTTMMPSLPVTIIIQKMREQGVKIVRVLEFDVAVC